MADRGRLFVVAAPSGAGKTSLLRALLERRPALQFSVSCTTRPPRPHERPGHDYFFVSPAEFQRLVENDGFIEHAEVFGHRYGTPRQQVETALTGGCDLVLEIDWQGARQVRERLPEAVQVFILPPSRAELEARLRGRGTDSAETIARRLGESVDDMRHWREFDYVVINGDFTQALAELETIVDGRGEASRRDRPWLETFVTKLLVPAE